MVNKAKKEKDADDIYDLFVMEMKEKLSTPECPSQVMKLAFDFIKFFYVDKPAKSVDDHIEEKVDFPFKKID
tara:strand:- start:590 stop:805 length:216 start_codon:yes stop_codon:yes gene_type:complete